jgi:hypothetical protein
MSDDESQERSQMHGTYSVSLERAAFQLYFSKKSSGCTNPAYLQKNSVGERGSESINSGLLHAALSGTDKGE